MEINICSACGAVFKPRSKDCSACGAVQSKFATTVVPTMAGAVAPMVVSVAPDRLILERIVTARQLNTLVPSNFRSSPEDYSSDDYGSSEFYDAYGRNEAPEPQASISVPQQSAPVVQDEPLPSDFNFTAATGADVAQSAFYSGADTSQVIDQAVSPELEDFDPNEGVARDDDDEVPADDIPSAPVVEPVAESFEPPAQPMAPQPAPEVEQPRAGADFFDTRPDASPAQDSQDDQAGTRVTPQVAAPMAAQGVGSGTGNMAVSLAVPAGRPQVAGPADLNRNKAGDSKPRSAPITAEAFDFFQSSPANSRPARPVVQSPTPHTAATAEEDPHSSFENLLSKSSRSGNYKAAEVDESDSLKSARDSKKTAVKELEKPKAAKKARLDDDDDDDDDDFEPVKPSKKVAPKNGKLSKSRSRSRDEEDDVDDDDDDDVEEKEDEVDEVPMRRSFSGTSTRPQKVNTSKSRPVKGGAKKDTRTRKKNDDDDDDDDSLRKKMSGGALFHLAGFPIGAKLVAISVVLMGMAFFAVAHVIGNFATLSKAPDGSSGTPISIGSMLPQHPIVSGVWQLRIFQGPNVYPNQIELHQQNEKLWGRGIEKNGPFIVTGYLTRENDASVIFLKKQFQDRNQRNVGPPITLKGNIFVDTIPLSAQGQWQFKKKSGTSFGYLNKEQISVATGDWNAKVTRPAPMDAQGTPIPTVALGANTAPPVDPKKVNPIDFMSKYGIFIALGLGIAVVGGSASLFGPSGLINIWNKQQYIPSQFKAQHGKIRGKLAKPLKKGSLPLGQRVEWKPWLPLPWIIKDLAIPPDMRKVNPHLLILGQGGKGKSRLVAGMVAHDIESEDRSVILVDSDGSLVDLITQWISSHPKGREIARRVVLIDPVYKDGSVCYNPINLHDMGDLQTAAASIVDGFKAIYTEPPGSQSQWNAQTADILRNAILLLIGNNKTLIDLPTLLNENDFRDVLLENIERKKGQRIEFATLLDQWGRYKKLARTDQWITWVEPILNRINPMLSNPRIRTILTKQDGDLDLMEVITKKKILLVRIPQGDFGQDANLLGSLIVSGVKQTCLTLSAQESKDHHPVALYLDNFDNFIEKNTIEAITSETKKFKIGLIAVTKSLQHLPEDFRNQLIINVGTLLTFALSKKDGDLLGPQMFPIDGRKVKNETMANIFNRVNTTPQFELVSDEEKLNIDKVVRQEERTFYAYRMGAEAGLFNLKAHKFDDIPESKIKKKLIEKMHLSGIRKSDTVD